MTTAHERARIRTPRARASALLASLVGLAATTATTAAAATTAASEAVPALQTAPLHAAAWGDDPTYQVTWPAVKSVPVNTAMEAVVTVDDATLMAGPVQVTLSREPTFEDGNRDFWAGTLLPETGRLAVPLPTAVAGEHTYRIEVDEWDTFTDTIVALRYPSSIRATMDGGTFKVGKRALATGQVPGGAGRRVELQARGANGTWVPMASTQAEPSGAFTLPLPTWWVTDRAVLRAAAPATDTYAEAATEALATMKVTRQYKPRKGARSWANLSGTTVRWNPCTPIGYALNPKRMPKSGPATVRRALAEVSQASGLRFQYVGSTSLTFNHRDDFPEPIDFVISWATPRQVRGLTGGTIGLGGPRWTSSPDAPNLNIAYQGSVVIDVSQPLRTRTAKQRRDLQTALMMHEIGHAVGLGHVQDRRQQMYPSLRVELGAKFGAGDLTGLTKMGALQGCLPDVSGSSPWWRPEVGPHVPTAQWTFMD